MVRTVGSLGFFVLFCFSFNQVSVYSFRVTLELLERYSNH